MIQYLSYNNNKSEINLMSKTMTTTQQSLIQLTGSIQLKDVITFQINSQSLNQNFLIIKECLLKMQQLQSDMSKERANKENFNKLFTSLQSRVQQNQKTLQLHDNKIKELRNDISDDFMKKLYDIEEKSKKSYDFDETVKKLEQLNKFVLNDKFLLHQNHINDINNQIAGLKKELNHYVQNSSFNKQKDKKAIQLQQIRQQIKKLNQKNLLMTQSLQNVSNQCKKTSEQLGQNSKMIKQMNFGQLLDKIKKHKEDTDYKIGQFSIKLKKKCGFTDLHDLESNIVQRFDKFFKNNQKSKASLDETKDALVYLQKRLNEIYQILMIKQKTEENDALFSSKKIQCASCTKDLGRYQGKLGQFRPWAIFPCKQLDPEKTGGFGYSSYVDKMQNRRGSVLDDSGMDRINKTFNEKIREQESPRKINTARSTNFMESFGDQTKQSFSLRDQYFKEVRNDKTAGNRFFRVKKDPTKPSTALESVKQRMKEI